MSSTFEIKGDPRALDLANGMLPVQLQVRVPALRRLCVFVQSCEESALIFVRM
jgi:hypothetical protein